MNNNTEEEMPSVLTSETENATNINYNEASYEDQPDKYRNYGTPKYKRLSLYNRGWNGPNRENKEVTHRQDNLAVFDALAGQLELTSYQKTKGKATIDKLDLQRIVRSIDLVALCACILVANDDVVDGYRYWPRANNADADFQRVIDGIDYDLDDVLSMMLKLDSLRDEGL